MAEIWMAVGGTPLAVSASDRRRARDKASVREVLSPKPPTRILAGPRAKAILLRAVASLKGRTAAPAGKASATGTPLGGGGAATTLGGLGIAGVEATAGKCRPGTFGFGGGAAGRASPARASREAGETPVAVL